MGELVEFSEKSSSKDVRFGLVWICDWNRRQMLEMGTLEADIGMTREAGSMKKPQGRSARVLLVGLTLSRLLLHWVKRWV